MIPAEYLVSHGRAAFLGRFANRSGARCAHGERVVVRSARGFEAGTVLGEVVPNFSHLVGPAVSGDLLRSFGDDDAAREAHAQALAEEIVRTAGAIDPSVMILDAEVTLDGARAYLEGLPAMGCDVGALCEALSRQFALAVAFLDPRQATAKDQPPGCGKPGCGSTDGGCSSCGDGGCSTGGCSRGNIGSAEELTTYFAGLRRQMEAAGARVPLFTE